MLLLEMMREWELEQNSRSFQLVEYIVASTLWRKVDWRMTPQEETQTTNLPNLSVEEDKLFFFFLT